MATSDNAIDTVEQRSSVRSGLPSPSRYDVVLAIIPSVFIVSILIGHLLSLSSRSSIVVASLLGALAVGEALFLNPPQTDGE